MRLGVVTATLDWMRAEPCVNTWQRTATGPLHLYTVGQGGFPFDQWTPLVIDPRAGTAQVFGHRQVLGVVPAFAIGVRKALEDGCEIIACLHDDLDITSKGWDQDVIHLFKTCPRAGLCGFGGGKGLADDDIYQTPYNPMQLARKQFISNMRDAEAHGQRSEVAQPVACLDGFSQIGMRSFWMAQPRGHGGFIVPVPNLFEQMASWGIVHHWYDGALGAFAKRLGYQVWYLPVACHHYGGRTAVGDARYVEWAKQQTPDGDAGFWQQAHRIGYDQFRDTLPIRT